MSSATRLAHGRPRASHNGSARSERPDRSLMMTGVGRGQRRQRRPPGVVPAGAHRPGRAEQFAIQVPELVLRDEPAHLEAFIRLGPTSQTEPARWQLITQSLQSWGQEHEVQPTELGARITYLADTTVKVRTATLRSRSTDQPRARGSKPVGPSKQDATPSGATSLLLASCVLDYHDGRAAPTGESALSRDASLSSEVLVTEPSRARNGDGFRLDRRDAAGNVTDEFWDHGWSYV